MSETTIYLLLSFHRVHEVYALHVTELSTTSKHQYVILKFKLVEVNMRVIFLYLHTHTHTWLLSLFAVTLSAVCVCMVRTLSMSNIRINTKRLCKLNDMIRKESTHELFRALHCCRLYIQE